MKNDNIAEELENNFFNSLFSIASKTWVNITITNIVYLVFILLLVGGIFASTIGPESLQIFSPQMQQNPELIQGLFQNQFSNFGTPLFIVGMLISTIVILLVASWMLYFSYIATTEYLKNDNRNFMAILKQSFDVGIFRMLGIFLLLYLIMIVLGFLAAVSVSISGIIAFLLFVGVSILMFRFLLVIPAYIVGKLSLSDSFSFSFTHITWFKALKYFGITILASLVLILFSFIVGLFSLLLNMIPFVGVAIQFIIQIIMGGFFTALGAALCVGMYYRATGELKSTEEEDTKNNNDLIIDSLQ